MMRFKMFGKSGMTKLKASRLMDQSSQNELARTDAIKAETSDKFSEENTRTTRNIKVS